VGRRRNTAGAELRGCGLAGDAQSGVPVADSGHGLALEQARGTRDLLGLLARGYSGRNRARGGGGGTAAANSPASGRSDT